MALVPFGSPIDKGQLRVVSSDPTNAKEGQMILNTASGAIKVYFQSAWVILHTLVVTVSNLLLESGDAMLLESGDNMLMEG